MCANLVVKRDSDRNQTFILVFAILVISEYIQPPINKSDTNID